MSSIVEKTYLEEFTLAIKQSEVRNSLLATQIIVVNGRMLTRVRSDALLGSMSDTIKDVKQ